jgi:arginyl-tRNA synthetase
VHSARPIGAAAVNAFQHLVQPILAAYPALEASDLPLGTPPKLDLGDLALPLFLAAKKLGCPPPKLAAEIAAQVAFGQEVTAAVPAGPYLNLKVDRGVLARRVADAIRAAGAAYGSDQSGAGRRVLLEHTSINPNASPHVGRARNAMIGDSLARLLRFAGYEVEVHYYVNDMGRQIGLLVLMADELQNLTFDEILDTYVKANARAEADPDFAAAGYALLAKMEEGDPETQAKFRQVTDLCLQGQLAVLARIGATYDVFDHESKYVKDPRLDEIVAGLKARNAFAEDKEGRITVDLGTIGHAHEEGRYFVLMRANGSSMYGYRDLAYTIDKAARGADLNLMVLGEDHKLYAQQLALILDACGHPAPEAVYYAYILLKDGKMSTRQGTVVLLSDFLDQAEALAAERVAEQCAELAPEEQRAIAAQVAVAAIRFAVLRVNPGKNVTFDIDQALSFAGDTGPYVQYCCARINSILRRAGDLPPADPAAGFPATTHAEWGLALKLAEFPGIVSTAVRERSVAGIGGYALDLARAYTTFYHDCPVLKAESPALAHARLELCRATLQTLTNALHLLGIAAPERM